MKLLFGMTMRERIKSGKLFTDNCEGLAEERILCKKILKKYNDSLPDDYEKRRGLLEQLFGQKGQVWIEAPFHCCYGKHIAIGKGTYINFDCHFVDDGFIYIGNHVLIGPAVTIATVGHSVYPDLRKYMYTDAVTIANNCWIGANVTICPGVMIGENSVIGAGSVVVDSIPENVVAAGNPCRVIRAIGENDRLKYYKERKLSEEEFQILIREESL